MEVGALDYIEIVLTPFGAPIGMIEGGALDFGVVVGEVNDQLIGAGRKRLEDLFVGLEPLGFGDAGHHLKHAVEDDRIRSEVERGEIGVVAIDFVGEKDGEIVGLAGGEIDLGEILGAGDGAHVGVEMGEMDASGFGFINLRVGFSGDVGHFGVGYDVGGEERKIAVGVEKTGAGRLRRDGRPTVAGPIGVEGEMDAEVGIRMCFGPLGDLGEPGAGDEDAGGRDPVFIEGFEDGGVDGVHHAEIVGVDDEEAGVGGVA